MAKRLSNDRLPLSLALKYIVAKARVAGKWREGRVAESRVRDADRGTPAPSHDKGLTVVCLVGRGWDGGAGGGSRWVAGATVTGMPEGK